MASSQRQQDGNRDLSASHPGQSAREWLPGPRQCCCDSPCRLRRSAGQQHRATSRRPHTCRLQRVVGWTSHLKTARTWWRMGRGEIDACRVGEDTSRRTKKPSRKVKRQRVSPLRRRLHHPQLVPVHGTRRVNSVMHSVIVDLRNCVCNRLYRFRARAQRTHQPPAGSPTSMTCLAVCFQEKVTRNSFRPGGDSFLIRRTGVVSGFLLFWQNRHEPGPSSCLL